MVTTKSKKVTPNEITENIFQSIKSGFKNNFKAENNKYAIKILDVHPPKKLPGDDDYVGQKKAKLGGKDYLAPIAATFEITDKIKGTKTKVKAPVGGTPIVTDRGSVIYSGKEYQVANQMRRSSGVYTHTKQNGIVETDFNLQKGLNFKLSTNPEKGAVDIIAGTARIPAMPILKLLGTSDKKLEEIYGKELYDNNKKRSNKTGSNPYTKFASIINGEKIEDEAEAKNILLDYFNNTTKLDPKKTKMTLGIAATTVSQEVMERAVDKLIKVTKDEEPEDNIDSFFFKEVLPVNKLVEDKINRTLKQHAWKSLFKLNRDGDIEKAIPKSALRSSVKEFFTKSALSNYTEQTNPIQIALDKDKTSIFGDGGISSPHAIVDSQRNVEPTQLGFLDPVYAPESNKIGAVNVLASGARVSADGVVTTQLVDRKGKEHYLTSEEAFNSKIAFPDELTVGESGLKFDGNKVRVMHLGKIKEVASKDVEYAIPSAGNIFSEMALTLPFMQNNQGNRANMAARQTPQAVPLTHREMPLVQVGNAQTGESTEALMGNSLNKHAPVSGSVTKITKDKIVLTDGSGRKHNINIQNNLKLNNDSFYHHTPIVAVGDKVKKGKRLTEHNFTKDGVLALGKNIKVAYTPWEGINFEDAVVMTESGAKAFTSEHTYIEEQEKNEEGTILGKNAFTKYYPKSYNNDQLDTLDADGVVKPGTILKKGDPIMLVMNDVAPSPEELMLKKFSTKLLRPYRDSSKYWTKDVDAEVIEVSNEGGTNTVVLKTLEPAKIGDKVVMRHGNKAIISKIITDEEAPYEEKTGDRIDLIYAPATIPKRMTIGPMLELKTAEVAKKRGPIVVQNFAGRNYLEDTTKLMLDNGVEDKVTLVNPTTGAKIDNVFTGTTYLLKQKHKVDKKIGSRFTGGYDLDQAPTRGGSDPSQSEDRLTAYSLMAHGTPENMTEMAVYKNQKNPEFWEAVQTGRPIPKAKAPFAYEKFEGMLNGMGVKIKKDNGKLQLLPLHDAEVEAMSSGAVKSALVVRGKDLKPIKEGLFDPVVFGGVDGTRWGHIELKEPVINPIFKHAVAQLLELKESDVDAVYLGKKNIDSHGVIVPDGGMNGPEALAIAMDNVQKTTDIQKLTELGSKAKGSQLNKINRKIRFLKTLNKAKMTASEAYMQKKIPVLPPVFRPIYSLPGGVIEASDVNHLYKNLVLANKLMADMEDAPDEIKEQLRGQILEDTNNLAGLGVSNPTQARDIKGLMQSIAGNTAKEGFFQKKLFKRTQDLSGRSTITSGPELGPDEIVIPYKMAKNIFAPFAIKEMTATKSMRYQDAREALENDTPKAKKALEIAASKKLVILNRAPSLHKFSVMSFKPTISEDTNSIVMPHLPLAGFNADFDGDTVSVQVPVTAKAQAEAEKMLPSRNLFQLTTGKPIMAPSQESLVGLHVATTPKWLRKTKLKYKDIAGLKEEWNAHKLKGGEIVTVAGKVASVGQHLISNDLPGNLSIMKDGSLDKKSIGAVITRMAKENPKDIGKALQTMIDYGYDIATREGTSFGIADITVNTKNRDKIFADAERKSRGKSDDVLIDNWLMARKKAVKDIDSKADKNNSIFRMYTNSGGAGGEQNLQQVMVAPVLVFDNAGKIVAQPIKKSFAEGLPLADYWTHMYGARKGMTDKALSTAKPGYLTKQVVSSMAKYSITRQDCGTTKGISKSTNDWDITGRVLATGFSGVKAGTMVDHNVLTAAKRAKIKTLKVRSPITCESPEGLCAKCFGSTEHGGLPKTGDNIGINASQAITEPLTQMAMRTFHTGGIATDKPRKILINSFDESKQLLTVPKNFKFKSTLSPFAGKVDKATTGALGETRITIDGKEVIGARGMSAVVKPGDTVYKGQPLTKGFMDPRDVLEHNDVFKARTMIANQLQGSFEGAGSTARSSLMELAARTITEYGVVKSPGDSTYAPGDIISLQNSLGENNKSHLIIPGNKAVRRRLAENTKYAKAGELISSDIASKLGDTPVKIVRNKLVVEPMVTGVNMIPTLGEDWMENLSFAYIKDAIKTGAAMGYTSDLYGSNPFPAWIEGTKQNKRIDMLQRNDLKVNDDGKAVLNSINPAPRKKGFFW